MSRFLSFRNLPFALVTTRRGGVSIAPRDSLNLGLNAGDDPRLVEQNRLIVASALGAYNIVYMNQIHGDRVVLIDKPPVLPPECDAMISNLPDIALAVLTADCVPMLFFDPKTRSIGAAHAGWRGTATRISVKTIEAMRENFGSNPNDIMVGIAPAICEKCYGIGEDLAKIWRKLPRESRQALKGDRLDLPLANRLQLLSVGVLECNIETMALCTYENDDFFSYRKASPTGRFASIIALKP
ncbi:MAG: peptidoglycan editing factor PgeF [Helicobacteraceae bacterium]|jgi:YfiH family protein|nr:peptidoglycan editing factor PgeF [Helicobacteraceae bacterium]